MDKLINTCVKHSLTPDEYVFIYLLSNKNLKRIIDLYTPPVLTKLNTSLVQKGYFLSGKDVRSLKKIILSKKVKSVFGNYEQQLNFGEFLAIYPHKVGPRILGTQNIDTTLGKKLQKKYLSHVKTKALHTKILVIIEHYLEVKRNNLEFLPKMETFINGRIWEQWEEFLQSEEKDINLISDYGGEIK